MPDFRAQLESLTREQYGRVAYTHKTHMKMMEIRVQEQRTLKTIQIIVSAVIAGGAVGAAFTSTPILKIATALLATASLILNSYLKDVNPGAEAAKHLDTAAQLWKLREQFLVLISDTHDPEIGTESLRERRDQLLGELAEVYRGAPSTNSRAYAAAQEALKNREDLFFSEDELNMLLPHTLRAK